MRKRLKNQALFSSPAIIREPGYEARYKQATHCVDNVACMWCTVRLEFVVYERFSARGHIVHTVGHYICMAITTL